MSEKYRYDLHVHTYEGSACAKSPAAELADFYKEKGYAGLVVTDHFYAGNTRVDRSLPWPEWLKGFKEGYEHMKARGDEIGLSVFYGWEYSFHGIDFLTFGLDNDWLLEHPEVKDMDIVDYELYRSGNYLPATVSAVYSFIDKMISALAPMLATFLITFVGYTGSLIPQAEDPLTFGRRLVTVALFCVMPIIGWILTILAMKKFSLTKEKMEEIQLSIATQKAEAKEAEE